MSDNRPAPAKEKTLADYYNDFFVFLLDMVIQCAPEGLLKKPEISNFLEGIPDYCSDDKKFVLVHYGVVKKFCSDPHNLELIRNIIGLVDETPESRPRMDRAIYEIKTIARHIAQICQGIIEAEDLKIEEKLEEFSLFVDILTRQFVPVQKHK